MQQWKQDKRMISGKVIPKVGRSYIFACIYIFAPNVLLRIPKTYDNIPIQPNPIRPSQSL